MNAPTLREVAGLARDLSKKLDHGNVKLEIAPEEKELSQDYLRDILDAAGALAAAASDVIMGEEFVKRLAPAPNKL